MRITWVPSERDGGAPDRLQCCTAITVHQWSPSAGQRQAGQAIDGVMRRLQGPANPPAHDGEQDQIEILIRRVGIGGSSADALQPKVQPAVSLLFGQA